MNRLGYALAIGSIAALAGSLWGEEMPTESPLRLVMDLADGSRLIGTPGIESVPVRTPYARMDIPLHQILAIQMGDDHETAALDLVNGDKLKGVITLKPLELTTVFGPVKVGIEHLREIAVVSSGEGMPATLMRGLVLYYPFDWDEGAKVTDMSGEGHDGKANGAKWTTTGKRGGGVLLDGRSAYITVKGFKGVTGNRPMTIAAWARSDAYWNGGQYIIYFGNAGKVGGGFGLCYRGDADHSIYGLSGGDDLNVFGGNAPQADGLWHHAVLTTDGRTISLYIDGQLARSVPTQNRFNVIPHDDVQIGQAGGGCYLNGALDEVCIYDRALSSDEVKMLYEARK